MASDFCFAVSSTIHAWGRFADGLARAFHVIELEEARRFQLLTGIDHSETVGYTLIRAEELEDE